jgi:hypothetical protein
VDIFDITTGDFSTFSYPVPDKLVSCKCTFKKVFSSSSSALVFFVIESPLEEEEGRAERQVRGPKATISHLPRVWWDTSKATISQVPGVRRDASDAIGLFAKWITAHPAVHGMPWVPA